MAISGTVPHFSLGPVDLTENTTVVTVTGVSAGGIPTGTYSTEGLHSFYRRCLVAFGGISGVQVRNGTLSGQSFLGGNVSGTSGAISGQLISGLNAGVILTSAQLSGIITGMTVSGGVATGLVGGVILTSAQLSGLMQVQREIAMRAADITHSFEANGPRLTEARRMLAISGGEIKGLA